jgi:hypothetical protein
MGIPREPETISRRQIHEARDNGDQLLANPLCPFEFGLRAIVFAGRFAEKNLRKDGR